MSEPTPDGYKLELTNREVIERKLLTALSREDCVAILVSQADLRALIYALESLPTQTERSGDLLIGLRKLLTEAFK